MRKNMMYLQNMWFFFTQSHTRKVEILPWFHQCALHNRTGGLSEGAGTWWSSEQVWSGMKELVHLADASFVTPETKSIIYKKCFILKSRSHPTPHWIRDKENITETVFSCKVTVTLTIDQLTLKTKGAFL